MPDWWVCLWDWIWANRGFVVGLIGVVVTILGSLKMVFGKRSSLWQNIRSRYLVTQHGAEPIRLTGFCPWNWRILHRFTMKPDQVEHSDRLLTYRIVPDGTKEVVDDSADYDKSKPPDS